MISAAPTLNQFPMINARQRLRSPLQPLDVATITLNSPKVAGMTTPQYKFEQNNGTVKPVPMKGAKTLKAGPAS